jgi:hypothetical protein
MKTGLTIGISLAGAWYRAVSAMLARVHNHADAVVHLRRARELFPLDADILFDSGCLYETFAAPPIQAVVQSTALTRGSFYDFSVAAGQRRRSRSLLPARDRDPPRLRGGAGAPGPADRSGW